MTTPHTPTASRAELIDRLRKAIDDLPECPCVVDWSDVHHALNALAAAPEAGEPVAWADEDFSGFISDRAKENNGFYLTKYTVPLYAAPLAQAAPPAEPQHVCGLQGFGALGDVCPACAAARAKYESSRLAPQAAPAVTVQASADPCLPVIATYLRHRAGESKLASTRYTLNAWADRVAALAATPAAETAEQEACALAGTGFRGWILRAYPGREPGQRFSLSDMQTSYVAGGNRNEMRHAQRAAETAGLKRQIEELQAEVDDLSVNDESDVWPGWAEQILKTVREFSGYDGYDDQDGIDLPSEVHECLSELAAQADRARKALAAAETSAQASSAAGVQVTKHGVTMAAAVWERIKDGVPHDYTEAEFRAYEAIAFVKEQAAKTAQAPVIPARLPVGGPVAAPHRTWNVIYDEGYVKGWNDCLDKMGARASTSTSTPAMGGEA